MYTIVKLDCSQEFGKLVESVLEELEPCFSRIEVLGKKLSDFDLEIIAYRRRRAIHKLMVDFRMRGAEKPLASYVSLSEEFLVKREDIIHALIDGCVMTALSLSGHWFGKDFDQIDPTPYREALEKLGDKLSKFYKMLEEYFELHAESLGTVGIEVSMVMIIERALRRFFVYSLIAQSCPKVFEAIKPKIASDAARELKEAWAKRGLSDLVYLVLDVSVAKALGIDLPLERFREVYEPIREVCNKVAEALQEADFSDELKTNVTRYRVSDLIATHCIERVLEEVK